MGILYQLEWGAVNTPYWLPMKSRGRTGLPFYEGDFLDLSTVGLFGGGVLTVVVMNVVVDLGSHVLFPVFVDDGVIISCEMGCCQSRIFVVQYPYV